MTHKMYMTGEIIVYTVYRVNTFFYISHFFFCSWILLPSNRRILRSDDYQTRVRKLCINSGRQYRVVVLTEV